MNVQDTIIWDPRYELPLSPRYSNPHLYLAYAVKHFKLDVRQQYKLYICSCAVEWGLYNRWPGKYDELTSHDELVGIAYLSPYGALTVLDYLQKNWGFYDNRAPFKKPLKQWKYRFYWLVPYLKARAGKDVGIVSDLLWAVNCVFDALSQDKGQNGHLLIWIMEEAMQEHPISRLALKFWRYRMKRRWGIHEASDMLTRYFNKADEVEVWG